MKYLLVCLIALTSFASKTGVDRVRQEYEALLKKKYVLLPHKGIYLLPASYNNTPNKEAYQQITERFSDRGEFNRELEAEFQVSFLILVNQKPFGSKFNLFLGYTHRSWWQVYNGDWSRQFRETNYEPEFFARRLFTKPKKVLGLNFIGYDFGYVHQSNGQIQELSRSWDRAFTRMIFNFGSTVISPSLWYRLPDTDNLDENPDTEEYIGHGELLIQKIYGPNQFRFKLLPGIHKMGAEFSYSYPLNEGLRYFIKLNYGYGHSLIDYNKKTERIGVGISISDILSGLSE